MNDLSSRFDALITRLYEAGSHRREYLKAFNAKRPNRQSGRVSDRSSTGGQFVAIDSEGINIGEPFTRDGVKRVDQRTCLWMAGGVSGRQDESIVNLDGCNSKDIFEFLLSLPRAFHVPGQPRPIFISFGFSYDAAQIVKDLPFANGWEVHHGKSYECRDDPKVVENLKRVVLWGQYGISIIPRKSVTLYRLRDHNNPFTIRKRRGERDSEKKIDYIDRIKIYDTFGFFQQRLTGAIEAMPGIISDEELSLIKAGKEERGQFKIENIEEIKRYTSLELKALVAMIEKLRTSLATAIPGKPVTLKDWQGAGSIASALLDEYLPKGGVKGQPSEAQLVLGNVADDTPWREWAFHAYFGGRIELVKQGMRKSKLYEYDIASAYPSIAVQMPNMKGGVWEHVINPTRQQIENASIVSMVHIRTHHFQWFLPFYPLPYRKENGAIMFPASVNGYYMRDHAIAAFKYFDEFERLGKLSNFIPGTAPASIELISAWLFHPLTDDKPLAWVKTLFDYRATLKKTDVRSDVIKLGINSVYGKLAQRVGEKGKPPKHACPWFAAAITAGTQRRLIEAALTDPDAIIAFATDGIYSTRPLALHIPPKKELGEWELKIIEHGGCFVQSGVYTLHGKKLKVKSRGFSPQNIGKEQGLTYAEAVDKELYETIPQMWAKGENSYPFKYQQYYTIGLSVVNHNTWRYIGHWKIAPRVMQLDTMSNKRVVPNSEYLRQQRAVRLVDLIVNQWNNPEILSAKSVPEWLSVENETERDADEESANIAAGLS